MAATGKVGVVGEVEMARKLDLMGPIKMLGEIVPIRIIREFGVVGKVRVMKMVMLRRQRVSHAIFKGFRESVPMDLSMNRSVLHSCCHRS